MPHHSLASQGDEELPFPVLVVRSHRGGGRQGRGGGRQGRQGRLGGRHRPHPLDGPPDPGSPFTSSPSLASQSPSGSPHRSPRRSPLPSPPTSPFSTVKVCWCSLNCSGHQV